MTTSDSERPPLSERTAFLANKVGQLLNEEIERAFGELDLTGRSFYVLTVLERDVPKSQQELAQLVMVDATTMGGLIDQLDERGLVERTRNRADRRRYDLTLSDKGVEKREAANRALDATERVFFAPLDKSQRKAIHGLLQQLLVDRWPPKQ